MDIALKSLNTIFFVAIAIACALIYYYMYAKFTFDDEEMATKILEGKGYKIIHINEVAFGPWIMKSQAQRVYAIVVQMHDGEMRRGHVRLGGFFTGLYSDKIAFQWDGGKSGEEKKRLP